MTDHCQMTSTVLTIPKEQLVAPPQQPSILVMRSVVWSQKHILRGLSTMLLCKHHHVIFVVVAVKSLVLVKEQIVMWTYVFSNSSS